MKHSEAVFEIISHAVDAKVRHPEWRWGQSVFNTAHALHNIQVDVPDFINPFNDDSRVSLFLQWLEEELGLYDR